MGASASVMWWLHNSYARTQCHEQQQCSRVRGSTKFVENHDPGSRKRQRIFPGHVQRTYDSRHKAILLGKCQSWYCLVAGYMCEFFPLPCFLPACVSRCHGAGTFTAHNSLTRRILAYGLNHPVSAQISQTSDARNIKSKQNMLSQVPNPCIP